MNKGGRPRGQTVKTTVAQREKRERDDEALKQTRVDEERQAKRVLLEMMRGPIHKKVEKEVQHNDGHHICAHPAIQENDEHDTCTPAMVPNMESLPVMPKTRKERQEGIKYRHLNKRCDVIVKWKGGYIVCTCKPSGLCRGELRLDRCQLSKDVTQDAPPVVVGLWPDGVWNFRRGWQDQIFSRRIVCRGGRATAKSCRNSKVRPQRWTNRGV